MPRAGRSAGALGALGCGDTALWDPSERGCTRLSVAQLDGDRRHPTGPRSQVPGHPQRLSAVSTWSTLAGPTQPVGVFIDEVTFVCGL